MKGITKKQFIKKYDPEFSVQDALDDKLDKMKTDLDQLLQAEREKCAKIVEKERESQGNAYIYFNNKLAKITKAIRED